MAVPNKKGVQAVMLLLCQAPLGMPLQPQGPWSYNLFGSLNPNPNPNPNPKPNLCLQHRDEMYFPSSMAGSNEKGVEGVTFLLQAHLDLPFRAPGSLEL